MGKEGTATFLQRREYEAKAASTFYMKTLHTFKKVYLPNFSKLNESTINGT